MKKNLKTGKAEKKLKGGYATLNRKYGIGNKYKSAMGSFQDAAKLYNALGLVSKYAESLAGVALCQENLKNMGDACRNYQEAGRKYVESINSSVGKLLGDMENYEKRYQRAFHCFRKASDIYGSHGQDLQAGRLEKDIVSLITEEVSSLRKAIGQEEDFLTSVKKIKKRKKNKPEAESIEDISGEEDSEEEEEFGKTEEIVNIEEDKIDEKSEEEKKDIERRKKLIAVMENKIKSRVKLIVQHGNRGARFFEGIGKHANCNQTLEMSGDVCCLCGAGDKAVTFYETILDADWNAENTATGRRSSLEFVKVKIITKLLLGMLLQCSADNLTEQLSDIKSEIKRYVRGTRDFKNSDQHVLIHGICIGFQEGDMKRFQKAIRRYSKTNRLKDFMLNILTVLKKNFKKEILEKEESIL